MVTLNKYNIEGKQCGEVAIADEKVAVECHSQLIKDYLVALLENRRQWSASTKGRSEVKHTTKKPHPQKKTGRARHGDLVAPQFRGGGIAHGPKPKFDQHVRINRKEKKKAVQYLVAQKMKNDSCLVLDSMKLPEAKTKVISQFLTKIGAEKRVLFLLDAAADCESFELFARSARNLKFATVCQAENVNGYDLAKASHVICTEEALQKLQWL